MKKTIIETGGYLFVNRDAVVQFEAGQFPSIELKRVRRCASPQDVQVAPAIATLPHNHPAVVAFNKASEALYHALYTKSKARQEANHE